MASYEERSGSIRAVVRLPGGRKKSATFDTRREAEIWAKQMERAVSGKTPEQISAAGRTVTELLEAYFDGEGSRTDSARWNRIRVQQLSRGWLGDMRVSDVVPHDINRWLAERQAAVSTQTGKPISPSTASRELNLLSAAFRYGVRSLRWIATNPCHGVNRPEQGLPRDRPLLTDEELAAIRLATGYDDDPLLETSMARVGAAFLLALETGMRSGEILRIRPGDVDLGASLVRVSATERGGRKTSKSGRARTRAGRDVPLTPRAKEIITQLMQRVPEEQPVRDGQEFPPYLVGLSDALRDALWRKARDRSGVTDLKFHDSKHEACTRLARYIDVIALSHAIGTKDLKLIRDTYYQNDAAAQAAKLPAALVPGGHRR